MQTATETADILFPVYDLLHIQINNIHQTLWHSGAHDDPTDVGSRQGKCIFFFFEFERFFVVFFIIITLKCLSIGTPKNNEISNCLFWVSQNLGPLQPNYNVLKYWNI